MNKKAPIIPPLGTTGINNVFFSDDELKFTQMVIITCIRDLNMMLSGKRGNLLPGQKEAIEDAILKYYRIGTCLYIKGTKYT
jgi:hypothetical protein